MMPELVFCSQQFAGLGMEALNIPSLVPLNKCDG